MLSQRLRTVTLLCVGLLGCSDEPTKRSVGDGGIAQEDASVTLDGAPDTTTKDGNTTDIGVADSGVDAVGPDASVCPDVTGKYSASFGGVVCGSYSPQAANQRIDGSPCQYNFKFDGTSPAGIEGSFAMQPNGDFGPTTLKVGTQQTSCTGSVPSAAVVRLSCFQNSCIINLTRTGPL